MPLTESRLGVVLPTKSIGWAGGDSYVQNLRWALEELQESRKIWVWNQSKSWTQQMLLKVRFPSDVIHMPWRLEVTETQLEATRELQWIPDFQDVDLPSFFSRSERDARSSQILEAISRGACFYVSSSHASYVGLKAYPQMKILGSVRFARNPRATYKSRQPHTFSCDRCLTHGFIYWPSQWWRHKNHLQVIQSLIEQPSSLPLHIVMSGNQSDYRWPRYVDEVLAAVKRCNEIHPLGQVKEPEREWLLKNCSFLFNPSLYEGWSTTVEEAIFYGKAVLASRIPSILEQTVGYPSLRLFNPNDYSEILELLRNLGQAAPLSDVALIRQQRWTRFVSDLLSVISGVIDFSDT